MKILIVANYNPGKGGISGVVNNHFIKLQQEGFEVEIFSTKRSTLCRLFVIFALFRRAVKSEIVHIHGCSYWGFFPIVIGLFVSKGFLNRRSIVTYHGGGAELFLSKFGWFAAPILNRADVITVMSEYLKEVFLKNGLKTVILPNLVNIETDLDFQPVFDTPRLVSIRSLEKIYNINDILLSFKMVKNSFPGASLRVIGCGSLESELKLLASDLGLSDIEFIGRVDASSIPVELKKSNIMISVPSYDNQPMSILESFAVGLPVISTKVGGISDIIQDGKNGFLVQVNKPEHIYNTISWIMEHGLETKQVIIAARNGLGLFTWERIKPQLLSLYSLPQ